MILDQTVRSAKIFSRNITDDFFICAVILCGWLLGVSSYEDIPDRYWYMQNFNEPYR
ncbi:MAG: hypothetical protein ACEY3J_03585 [Arsenophonus sp.]